MPGISLKSESEESLLLLIKNGNYSAFEELYSRHFQTVFAMAYNILRDQQQSKDIVQDIFIWFWEHREQWDLTSCRGYLLTAVKFKTANYFRENKVRDAFFATLAHQQKTSEDDSVLIEVQQLNDLIISLTAELPKRCQEVFNLSRIDQLSNREIASKLNISEKTVEAHITLALRKLKGRLGKGNIFLFFLI